VSARRSQCGFLSLVALLMIVVLVALAIATGYLLAGSTLSASSHLGSMQAFFVAESGLESEQLRWAQNLDWYRSATDPNPAAPASQAFGAGSFAVNSTLPATLLKTQLTIGGATVNAYTTDRFPASGILQVDNDLAAGGELVRYAGVAGTTFTGVTRAQTVGSVASAASAHSRSTPVYPVTILRTSLANNCAALASMQVDSNGKFLGAGTLDIEGEELSYAGSSVSGGLMTLTGITRCLGTIASVSHAIGQPVTPVLVGGDSASYQAEMSSTGTVAPNARSARRTIER
jgi:hypothetical protein